MLCYYCDIVNNRDSGICSILFCQYSPCHHILIIYSIYTHYTSLLLYTRCHYILVRSGTNEEGQSTDKLSCRLNLVFTYFSPYQLFYSFIKPRRQFCDRSQWQGSPSQTQPLLLPRRGTRRRITTRSRSKTQRLLSKKNPPPSSFDSRWSSRARDSPFSGSPSTPRPPSSSFPSSRLRPSTCRLVPFFSLLLKLLNVWCLT